MGVLYQNKIQFGRRVLTNLSRSFRMTPSFSVGSWFLWRAWCVTRQICYQVKYIFFEMEDTIDPALDVPWSVYTAAASYNGLDCASGSFQTTTTDFQKTDLPGQAHITATLAGQLTQTTTFNSPCVDYESVLSPLFHHADPMPAHYSSTLNVSHHRQALTNAVTTTPSTVETEIINKDYSQAHHQTLVVSTNTSTCFDHQSTNSTDTWNHQGNSQLPRPFGILPHESVVVSSPSSSKPTSTYENTFNATHFETQTLNPLNSQLTNNSIDYSKTASCKDKKNANTGSSNNSTTLFDFFTADIAEYLTNRVPSPAQLNNTQTQQQQENDRYFDFERWDLHPSPPEMYNGAAEAFASHDINFVGNPAHQHQSLMVSHPHHPPPPIPYFTPFHLSPGHAHHPQEFHTSVELATICFSENTQPGTTNLQQQEVKYDNPKVIVPDIEEELEYLSQTAYAQAVLASQQNPNCSQQLPPPIKMPEKKQSDPNSGFVASYLKFLQGEKDTSPSPPKGDGRKTTWIRTKVYAPELKSTSVMGSKATTSGVPSAGRIKISAIPDCIKKGNKKPYNSDDDPRFYPLPKSTAIKKFDSSTAKKIDSDSSEVKLKPSKSFFKMSSSGTITSESSKGTTGKKTSGSSNKTSVSSSARKKVDSRSVPVSDPLFLPPRRETSKRRAKEKTTIKNFLDKQEQDDELEADDPDFVDSDSDPVWIPGAKGESDEDNKQGLQGRKKRSRSFVGKSLGSSLSKKKHDDSSSVEDNARVSKKSYSYSRSGQSATKNKTINRAMHSKQDSVSVSRKISEPQMMLHSIGNEPQDSMDLQIIKTGEFVVMKSDLHEKYPPIWRIDGEILLEKYEPFDENGKTLYRNQSTYSGWTAQNRHIYVTVPVRFRVQSHMETIVELLREEMNNEDAELMERVMKDLEKYHHSFEVYILALICQALDSNCLTKILQKQDEYYLNSVRAVDEVTEDHCRRLLNVTKWGPNLVVSVRTWPCIKVFQNLPKEQNSNTICSACGKLKVSMRIQMCGQPYNSTTLERCQPDPKALKEMDFLLCNSCGWQVSLCSKVAHQKYLMYVECVKRVTEKRSSNPNKDATCILIELLTDETWLNELFLEARTSWAEIQKIEHFSCESNKHLLQNTVASAGIS